MRQGVNLWVVPTHRSCNQKDKADEEHFYHALFPLVANANRQTGAIILNDLKRRAAKQQTRALVRSILAKSANTTRGGLALPSGTLRIDVDLSRLEQVAIKIGRCLFFRDEGRVMPYENCNDVRLFEREEDVPEFYQISWDMSKVNVHELTPLPSSEIVVVEDAKAGQALAADRRVFDYRSAYFEEKRLHLFSLRFWEAFIFCLAFSDPGVKAAG
jgi:hypothetical protein